mgnify:FL=1
MTRPDATGSRRADLAALCLGLLDGAEGADGLSAEEQDLAAAGTCPTEDVVAATRDLVLAGGDPLGDAYRQAVPPEGRRALGQTYTPASIIEAMTAWAADHGRPVRVVDPGCGSGRFTLAAATVFPGADVVACDVDPLATLMTRASTHVMGLSERVEVVLGDYRELRLDAVDGPTLFIGNPPFVRHHGIAPRWKAWLTETARAWGLHPSALAGLHIHFFLATARLARPGDFGVFVTSSEWLDVQYGRMLRELLLGPFAAYSVHVLDPEAVPFADALVTGAITCFTVGEALPGVLMRPVRGVEELGRLGQGREIPRDRLAAASRWSVFVRDTPPPPEGYIELGELVRVHRGAVTGANRVWVAWAQDLDLPRRVLFPSVTRARELFAAGDALEDDSALKVVIDLPVDLDVLDPAERRQVNRFLRYARTQRADQGYVASRRRAWYSVGLREPAPVLATYMARRPPAFVRNRVGARHINIAHGLYPREPLPSHVLDNLALYLRSAVTSSQGRIYAGGLAKFEPREMERLPVPTLASLARGDFS